MDILDQNDLKNMILSATSKVIDNKEKINEINYYPIPDKDTGTNLSATLYSLEKSISEKNYESISSLSKDILNASLLSAQGNSGMVITAFLIGFFEEAKKYKELNLSILASCFNQGSIKVSETIQTQTKGTIIDVVKRTAHSINIFDENSKLDEVFLSCLKETRKAVEDTVQEMIVLSGQNTVDAGSLGFYFFLEGMYEGLINKNTTSVPIKFQDDRKLEKPIEIAKNKYEVMFIINNYQMEANNIKEILSVIGDSFDFLSLDKSLKIHIHTDEPVTVKEIAYTLGEVTMLQITDMTTETIIENYRKKDA